MTEINKPIKPLMVAREEFASALADLINGSGLPPVVVQPLLERAAGEMNRLAQEQYLHEMDGYRRALQEWETKKDQTSEEG